MRTLFISDLHLDSSHPEIIRLFMQFLTQEATKSDALYILGDLFETFIGDDENTSLQQQVAKALSILRQTGVLIYFMHGNRDFLIGKVFAEQSQINIIPDPTIIDLYGTKTLLLHGDTLCTQDIQYLAFRKKVRNRFLQKIFLATPIKTRRSIAQKARRVSEAHNRQMVLSILDATPEEIPKVMQQYNVQQLIHGHTHRPALHYFWRGSELFSHIVLSDWEKSGHFLECYENGVCRLRFF